jgi:hypothetical protein
MASLGCAPFSIMLKFLQKNLLLLHFLSCESDKKSLCLVCSVLSYYGVHSFPIVFMHNRTSRVRYYGSRTLEAFTYFYQNYTGIIKSASKSQSVKRSDCSTAKLSLNVGTTGVKEVCPYTWAISPQKWFQDDAYLKLAFLFLITRLVCFLLPIVASAWKQH